MLAYARPDSACSQEVQGGRLATHDRNFGKWVAVHPGEKWGELNTPLWTLAFCNAEPREHCSMCLSLNHATTVREDFEATEESKAPTRAATSFNHATTACDDFEAAGESKAPTRAANSSRASSLRQKAVPGLSASIGTTTCAPTAPNIAFSCRA